jgi:hypothetical protein
MRGKGKNSEEGKAFYLQRDRARSRGIEFNFTYEEWCRWWRANLGPDWFSLRGCGKDKYVMARNGDKGPYAAWNVKCITLSENSREQSKQRYSPTTKLTKEQVIAIYLQLKDSPLGMTALARQHKVNRCTIKAIRTKKAWCSITDLLD